VSCSLFSLSAEKPLISLDDIHCVVDYLGQNRRQIPVSQTFGMPAEDKISYKDAKLAVGFAPGNRFEPQQILAVEINGYITKIYNPAFGSSYVMVSPEGINVQCYFENDLKTTFNKLEE